MTREAQVVRLLSDAGLALDDDEIALRLDMNRHYVNAVCRDLARRGILHRSRGASGRLVNQIGRPKASLRVEASPRSRIRRDDRARENVASLITGFGDHVERFEQSEAFPGPSLYFHKRALERLRSHASVSAALNDDLFFEYVYAVLPAWGMHRMGSAKAKVGPFDQMVESFRTCSEDIVSLSSLRITDVDPASAAEVAAQVWSVIARLKVSTSRTRIVAGSKALHHVLPGLVPPIDRQYTFRFFTGQMAVSGGDEAAFLDWFPRLCEVGRSCAAEINAAIERGGYMATGPAKVIDNAIMGFVQAARGVAVATTS